MKNGENNEIDLLLRDLAKRERAATERLEEGSKPENHLDADELNSFAEGVLPAATRSVYLAHLADCSRCRGLVAHLAVAAGTGLTAVSSEPLKSNWWNNLARFFTPALMRYAVPAMSIVILVAIGIVWLKQDRRADSVARRTGPALESYIDSNSQSEVSQLRKGDAAPNDSTKEAKTPASENAKLEAKRKPQNETTLTDSIERDEGKVKAERQDAPPPPAARPAEENSAFSREPPKEKETEQAKSADVVSKRQVPAAPTAAAAQRSEDRRNRQDKDDSSENKKAEAGGVAANRSVTVGRGMVTGSVGTRSVAGRQFRRLDNAWVDTAYESGAYTITLVRGSEQYRSVVGDEPGLRSIAEELKGEVIVVWKGRAYRIR
jgi:hypothetical protein